MKIFLLVLLTIVVVTAAPRAPSASDERKLQHVILAEIIQNVMDVKDNLTTKILVQQVITTEHCTPKDFCKAGNVLSAYKAEDLGLKEKDWLLPRRLVAYTRDIHCKDSTSDDQVQLRKLLHNIQLCAQKEYSKHKD